MMECVPPEKLNGVTNITAIFGAGTDGTDHPDFCQRYQDVEAQISSGKISSKAYALITSINLVRLVDQNNRTLWKCPAPMSVRYCRVVRISFEKETTESIRAEYERLQQQIAALQSIVINSKHTDHFHLLHNTCYTCCL